MSALRETTTPAPRAGNGIPATGRSPQARRPTATRPVGAAGVARRSLQRDLARREATLRRSRRGSGAASGISRPPVGGTPPVPSQPAARAQADPAPVNAPVPLTPQGRPAAPQSRPAAPQGRQAMPQARPVAPSQPQSRPVPAAAPRRAAAPGAGVGPQSRAGRAPVRAAASPQARATAPIARRADMRPPAPYGVGQAAALASALVAPAFVEPAPMPAPARPKLIALPGGATEKSSVKTRRVSNPAVLVASFVLLVLTVGAIVALQIRMTQISERVGSDLGAINVLQQKNTALKEANNRALSAARVNNTIASSRLIEPDVDALTFLNNGAKSATLAKAVRVLDGAPAAPTAAQLAAKAAAATATATGAVATGASATAAGAGTTAATTPAPAVAQTGVVTP